MRVGGSAWELNIDTKRFEDKKNMLFEDESERRSPKEKQKYQCEGQKK